MYIIALHFFFASLLSVQTKYVLPSATNVHSHHTRMQSLYKWQPCHRMPSILQSLPSYENGTNTSFFNYFVLPVSLPGFVFVCIVTFTFDITPSQLFDLNSSCLYIPNTSLTSMQLPVWRFAHHIISVSTCVFFHLVA